jgi:hypothetical protein
MALMTVIRIEENGASAPYVVYDKVSAFSKKVFPEKYKMVPVSENNTAFLLVCEKIKDAEWSDIPTEDSTEGYKSQITGSNVDIKV